jgi:hypothetical protein
MKELNDKKNRNRKKKVIRQKGGNPCNNFNNKIIYPTYDKGGTDGKFMTTFNDIIGVVRYSIGSLASAGCVVQDFATLRSDLGQTFNDSPPGTAPTPDDVKI